MLHQPRVLVVDDDENILSAFRDFFKREHCTMIAAANAEEGLSIVSQQLLNLVITDVRMKWQSGVTLLIKIKQSHPELPVIVITGYPNLIPEADIRHYGGDFYLMKPLELNQLRHAVRTCLRLPSTSTDQKQ